MVNLIVSESKTFLGSRDYEVSRDFYTALGWRVNWDNGDLAELEMGACKFYLQNYYQKKWCQNSMLHLTVPDAKAWYNHVVKLLEGRKYGAARVREPQKEDYGALVTYVWDPAGILLHFAQPLNLVHL